MTQLLKVIIVNKLTKWKERLRDVASLRSCTKESLDRMYESHQRHVTTLQNVVTALSQPDVAYKIIEGAETPFDSTDIQLVVTVGGDGTLLSASHHVSSSVPILAVNSDPVFSVGHFCRCTADNVATVFPPTLKAIKEKTLRTHKITRMKVMVDDKVITDKVLNEALFSHSCPAAMTRFELDGTRHACSGVWIGTGAGSTGAIASASGIIYDASSLQLEAVIREPWDPKSDLRGNKALMGPEFTLVNKTVDATLYFDGPFMKAAVGFDQRINFTVSDQHLSITY